MKWLSSLLLLAVGVLHAGDEVPVDQAALDRWWSAGTRLSMDESAYKVEGLTLRDGVCTARFDDGILVPVWSGQKPVSHRIVGLVFVGQGTLTVDFPQRADAWLFANHMVRTGAATVEAMAPIARGGKPLETKFTRSFLLSADPALERMLLGLDPVGSGVAYTETPEKGVDEVYVVTDTRGRLKAKAISTNLIPDRRRHLLRAGLDPIAMIREDRMLHESLGVPGEFLRWVGDFRTESAFGVADVTGKALGPDASDRWLTCFRDGMDASGLGWRSLAFAQGDDHEGYRHFQRFSGQPFPDRQAGGWPRLEPLEADIRFEARPARRGNIEKVAVDSTLTLVAHGGDVRHLALRLPASHALPDSFEVKQLALEDGTALPWVSLAAEGPWAAARGGDTTVEPVLDAQAASEVEAAEVSSTAGLSTGSETSSGDEPTTAEEGAGLTEASEDLLVQQTEYRYEIVAVLPKAVPDGQSIKVRLRWEANWQYANWTVYGRPLGPTTGAQEILPVVLGAPPGAGWSFSLTAGIPSLTVRTYSLAVSGDLQKAWEDEGTHWRWYQTTGSGVRNVTAAVGGWREYGEPSAEGMPAVRVHLFPSQVGGLREFPSEARRVAVFLRRFLPDYPQGEVEIFQGPSVMASSAVKEGFRGVAPGLVSVQLIPSEEAGDTSRVQNQYPFLIQRLVARQMAWQYWGEQVGAATARDAWLPQALADAYSLFYLRAGRGREAWDESLSALRKMLLDPAEREDVYQERESLYRPLSLSGTPALSDLSPRLLADYGAYVLAHSLRRRVGDGVYFRTLDRLAWEHAEQGLRTEDFQDALEKASGQDLDDFFDWWIGGGYLPSVRVQVRLEPTAAGTTVHGCVTSDIPFGTFELPVAVTDQVPEGVSRKASRNPLDKVGRSVEALVPVVDGRGTFTVPDREGTPAIAVDPDDLLLLWEKKVESVERTACEG